VKLDNRHSYVPVRSGSFAIIDTHVPVAGVHFPTDDSEHEMMFASESDCRSFIEGLRYPRGFVCSECGHADEPWRSGTGVVGCKGCRAPLRITKGSIFHGTRVPLTSWFRLLWQMCKREAGVSLDEAQEILGVRDTHVLREHYTRIRTSMARPAQENQLGNVVHVCAARMEVGEGQPVLALALQGAGTDNARVRLRHLRRARSGAIMRFIADNVQLGTRVHTPALKAFATVGHRGYEHRFGTSPSMNSVLAQLELWLYGAPDVTVDGLQSSLDDFSFRFNRRQYPTGLLFYRLSILATMADDPRAAATNMRATA
jgi:hypothetical protein